MKVAKLFFAFALLFLCCSGAQAHGVVFSTQVAVPVYQAQAVNTCGYAAPVLAAPVVAAPVYAPVFQVYAVPHHAFVQRNVVVRNVVQRQVVIQRNVVVRQRIRH